MKLQAALDTLTLEECENLLSESEGAIDIAEVGTPFIIEQGMVPVKDFKAKFPWLEVLADAKIMDAGKYEADKCFDAGADIVTVLGVSNDATIRGVVESAKNHGKKCMVDMIEVKELAQKAKEVGAKVVLITINPDSPIAKIADLMIVISAVSPKSAKQGDVKSIQPMGSLFEQSEALYLDSIVLMLMEKKHMDSDTMFGRHANME